MSSQRGMWNYALRVHVMPMEHSLVDRPWPEDSKTLSNSAQLLLEFKFLGSKVLIKIKS